MKKVVLVQPYYENICALLDLNAPERIEYVKDRVRHDHRYAIDSGKIREKLGWAPRFEFHQGIAIL